MTTLPPQEDPYYREKLEQKRLAAQIEKKRDDIAYASMQLFMLGNSLLSKLKDATDPDIRQKITYAQAMGRMGSALNLAQKRSKNISGLYRLFEIPGYEEPEPVKIVRPSSGTPVSDDLTARDVENTYGIRG